VTGKVSIAAGKTVSILHACQVHRSPLVRLAVRFLQIVILTARHINLPL
jgi:hypothetical protein